MNAPRAAPDEYWNPKNETMPREKLRALQFGKLRDLCAWAEAKSPFHRERFAAAKFSSGQLKTWDDIRRIPMMTREEWMASQAKAPPYGTLPACDPAVAVRYHTTSGTTGKTPLRALDGMRDWEWIADMWCYGFHGFGVRPTDTVFIAFSYAQFIGFWGAHYANEKLGATVIPSGSLPSETRVKLIVDTGATVLCATPTYVLRLAQVARETGVDLAKQSKVRRIILSGEPSGSVPAVRRQIDEAWNAVCGDTAGMTEIGTIFMFECRLRPGGTHVIEDHFIEEVINPETCEPVGYGEKGERVCTSFGRGILPLIRYRSCDIVEKRPAAECPCGRTFDIYHGGIQTRVDDMHKIRGTNVYPRAVEAIVREHSEIDEFQLVLSNDAASGREEVTVRVELKPGLDAAWSALETALVKELAEAHENLRINVERAGQGELPRFELKAKRLVDKRKKS
jgi:phenylacetate-CoA ligase